MINPARLLTVRQVAKRLRVAEVTVRRRIYDGSLPAFKLGASPKSHVRIDERHLDDWLLANTTTNKETNK